MRKWGFGIIGCGGIAKIHAAALGELQNARLVCAASRSRSKAIEMEDAFGCEWTMDYRELLERADIDIVCVTTSSGSHASIGRDVLAAGKHLILEKPITMEVNDAQQLIDQAYACRVQLSVISQRRFEPHFQQIKRLLEEDQLGKLLFIEAGTPYFRTQAYYDSADWRGSIAEDGGALMNQGIHQIDLLIWLGGPVKSVFGKIDTVTHQIEAEDIGVAVVKFVNGAIGTIFSSTSIKPGYPPYIHMYMEKGTIKIVGQSVIEWSVQGIEHAVSLESDLSDGSSNPLAISSLYHRMQFEQFLYALENGQEPLVGGMDGKRAVELIQAIYTSAATSTEVMLG